MGELLYLAGDDGADGHGTADSPFANTTSIVEGTWSEDALLASHSAVGEIHEQSVYLQQGALNVLPNRRRIALYANQYIEDLTIAAPVLLAAVTTVGISTPVASLPMIVRRAENGSVAICGSSLTPGALIMASTPAPFQVGFNGTLFEWEIDATALTMRFRMYVHRGAPDTFTGWGTALIDHTVSIAGTTLSISGATWLSWNLEGAVAAASDHVIDSRRATVPDDDLEMLAKLPPRVAGIFVTANGDQNNFPNGVGPFAHPDYRHVNEATSDDATSYDGCPTGAVSARTQLYSVAGNPFPILPTDAEIEGVVACGVVASGAAPTNNGLRVKVDGAEAQAPFSTGDTAGQWINNQWLMQTTPLLAVWTESRIAAMQTGYRRQSGANQCDISRAWLQMGFTVEASVAVEPPPFQQNALTRQAQRRPVYDHLAPIRPDQPLRGFLEARESVERTRRNELVGVS